MVPNWWKVIIFTVVMAYMIVNESERINTSNHVDSYDRRLEELFQQIELTGKFSRNHRHIYHDGKPYIQRLPNQLKN